MVFPIRLFIRVYFLGLDSKSQKHPTYQVGHVLTSIWAGGLESFVLSLSRGISEYGISSVVYSWTGDDAWAVEFRRHGIPVVAIGGPKRIDSVFDVWRFTRAWFRLASFLRRDRIRVLHTHDFLPSLVGRTASIAARVPARVTTLHNLYGWWPKWAHVANRLLARRTDAITCVSESVRDFMIERSGIAPSNLVTILNGVDETRFKPSAEARLRIRKELGIEDNEILIGNVGSITTRKAQWILVKAVAPMIRDGIRLQVRIWGANTSNPQHAESELRALIESEGMEDRIRFLPPRPDIEDVYNAMDIHCMTSVTEGLSLASVEAMMCGVVPVYSDIGPFKEVVEDGATGFLFKSEDPGSLEAVLRKALPRPDFLATAATAARSNAISKFGQSRMVREYHQLYKALLLK